MQQIFYNAKINMTGDGQRKAEAFLVNDGSIVFVGDNKEVLDLKTDDTELVDLKQKMVVPSFFALNCNLFKIIDNQAKNAKITKNSEKIEEFDENYEKFADYEKFKKAFLKLQDEILSFGITTIQELFIDAREFTFWKKLSEEKLLKLDVVAYVDMRFSKQVMDDNCRSFRKYKNHFRLGGYALSLDGDVLQKKAWLNKPYKKEHGYKGYSEYFDEQFEFLIKTAFEEKKQLVIETHGDKALDQFLRCFENVVINEKVEDTLRPIVLNCSVVNKNQYEKLKKLDVSLSFDLNYILQNQKQIKQTLGFFASKKVMPFDNLQKNELRVLLHGGIKNYNNIFELIEKFEKHLQKKTEQQNLNYNILYKLFFYNPAYVLFDQEFKGSIENGKQATFLVLDSNDSDFSKSKIENVYIVGEKVEIKK